MFDPKELISLKIYRQKSLAGTLTRTSDGCEFSFDKDFLKNSQFQGLAFSMPKTKTPYQIQGVNLHPFFAGLLPEGLRLSSIISNLKTSRDDLFTIFSATASHTVGDVYAESLSEEVRKPPKLKEINFYEYFRELTQVNSYALGEDALAGVQEKVSASVISFPLNIAKADKNYILKLSPKDKTNLVDNELHSMRLAARCRIKVANVKIVIDKFQNKGLLVERFDRVYSDNQMKMLHQEDFCQVLNRYPSEKYRLSLNEMIEGVTPFLSAEKASILKIIKIYCFSYLLGNGDLHAKNMSLRTSTAGLTDLSPGYDFLTTYIYGDQKMACKLDGRDSNIKRKQVIEFGKRFGLSEAIINQTLKDLVVDFSRNYLLLKNIEMEPKKWIQLEKMIQMRLSDLE